MGNLLGLLLGAPANNQVVITDYRTLFFLHMFLLLNQLHALAPGIGICGLRVSRDYIGASNVGIKALLLRRPGTEGEGEHKDPGEDLAGVSVVRGLSEVVDEVLKSRSDAQNFQASA